MAFFPYLVDKTILVGKVEEQIVPSISAFSTSHTSANLSNNKPHRHVGNKIPRLFVIQDRGVLGETGVLTTFNSEQINVIGITGSSGAYEVVLSGATGISHDYSEALGASILTPGVEQNVVKRRF